MKLKFNDKRDKILLTSEGRGWLFEGSKTQTLPISNVCANAITNDAQRERKYSSGIIQVLMTDTNIK